MVKNILIIINSDESVSQEVADYYASVRNYNFNYVSISFGPQTDLLTIHTDFETVVAIAEAIRSFESDIVICSAKVPAYFEHTVTGLASFEAVMGCSQHIVDQSWTEPMAVQQIVDVIPFITRDAFRIDANLFRTTTSGILNPAGTAPYGDILSENIASYHWNGNEKILPYGRIGLPRLEAYFPEETTQSCTDIIDLAIAAETTSVAPNSKRVHVSYPNLPGTRSDWPYVELASDALFYAQYVIRASLVGVTTPYTPTPAGYNLFSLGTYKLAPSVSTPDIWAFIGHSKDIVPEGLDSLQTAWENDPNPWIPNYGAWSATSGDHSLSRFGARLLVNGFCSVVGDLDAASWLDPNLFCRLIVTGASMAEANMYANLQTPSTRSVWGDPLYRPIGLTNSVVVG